MRCDVADKASGFGQRVQGLIVEAQEEGFKQVFSWKILFAVGEPRAGRRAELHGAHFSEKEWGLV